ncbi:MAG TPA: SulP family inorganic anion transporter [Phycisphaeraceae bacterium]
MPDVRRVLSHLAQPFLSPIRTARHYDAHKLRKDLLAGLTVAVVEVPQAMAYAVIAGVPPQYGLYTSILQGAIGALLSSSEHITTGPTNTQSLLVAATVQRLVGDPGNPIYLELVFALTMLKGLIQLGFAFARMGNITRYVSHSVIVGVMAGAGVLILAGQLGAFLGIPAVQGAATWPGVLGEIEKLWPHLSQVNGRAVGVGVLSLAVILGAQRVSPFLPGALLAMVLGAAVVWAAGWTGADLPLIAPLSQAMPQFQMPSLTLEQAESLFSGALALAIIGMLESVAIGKGIAAHSGERINANQEFFAQGFMNFVTSFFQCIPGSGSFTRSMLDYAAGAQTRFAALFNALFVLVIFWFLAPLAAYTPLASLAAVLFVIALKLIDWRHLLRVARSHRSDAAVCFATFLATLTLPLQYAIFVGIFLNIALYLRLASQLHLAEMVPAQGGPFLERPIHDRAGREKVIFLQAEGDLFFAVADELQERLAMVSRSGVQVVILRLKRTLSIDSTVLGVLERFVREMQARGGYVLLCGVRPDLMGRLERFGLIRLIGRENVFPTTYGVFTSAKQALQRARQLVGASLDVDEPLPDEQEAWTYEI